VQYQSTATRSASSGLAGVTAAVLAGGLGTRLRSVVADRPKVLAEVRGRPFLAYLLDQISAAGLGRVVLCTGHLGEQVEDRFGHGHSGLRLDYSRETSPLGTGGALRRALPLFESDPILVFNGDSYCDLQFEDFWQFHRTTGATGSLALKKIEDTRRYGRAMTQPDGTISGFAEKTDAGAPGWINAGIYLFSRALIDSIPSDRPASLEHEVLPSWVGRGLCGYRSAGAFLDIGTPEAYASTDRFFAARGQA
jgi:D-glycero-alpha-D-manno-heptose 1-phosphate guanylyltransferase